MSAAFLICLGGTAAANPFTGSGGRPVPVQPPHGIIVAFVPGSSLADWSSPRYPHLNEIVSHGAVALMNTRTARPSAGEWREPEAAAVATLSAGSRCAAPARETTPFARAESLVLPGTSAAQLAQRRSLCSFMAGSLVCPDWSRMISANSALGYPAQPGNLASSLRRSGVPVQSDGQGWSSLFAADADGAAAVSKPVSTATPGRNVYVADLGSDLGAADRRLAGIEAMARGSGADLLLISPFASDVNYRHDRRLTPVALWGSNIQAGTLYSYSTRRPGLICNTDIAPTIAAWCGTRLQTASFGRMQPLAVQPARSGLSSLAAIEADATRQRAAMQALPYFALLCGLWIALTGWPGALRSAAVERWSRSPIAAAVGRWSRSPIAAAVDRWSRSPIAAILPAAAMAALLVSRSPLELCAALPVSAAVAYILAIKFSPRAAVASTAAGVLFIVTADALAGSALMQRSTLGYSPIEGARYYGIGNEVMGVYLAAALVLLDSAWRGGGRMGKAAAAALACGVLAFMGTTGAKAGGVGVTIGMAAAYYFTATGGRWSARSIALVPAAGILATLLFAFSQIHSGAGEAHLGFSLQRVLTSGWSEVWSIVSRKMAVEAHLLWHSAWALPVWLGLAATAYNRHGGSASAALRASVIMTAVLTLLFNDAGAVAAALFLTFSLSWQRAMREGFRPDPEMNEGGPEKSRAAFDGT